MFKNVTKLLLYKKASRDNVLGVCNFNREKKSYLKFEKENFSTLFFFYFNLFGQRYIGGGFDMIFRLIALLN